ncbi:hypothetical protein PspLS_01519 [Pyricularia sp. CBS 133598]|nr:hypothetical protein PspLS_01519 [Pyricularia sp. CBS 133598]
MAIAEHTEPYISNMCKWDVKYDAKSNERKALIVKDCGDNRSATGRPTSQSLIQWLEEARQSNITLRLSAASRPASLQEHAKEKELDALAQAAIQQFDRDMKENP